MGANAVTSVPVYASGDVLTAANLNITNSGVPVFATTTTRDAAFGSTGEKTLAEGQVCYIEANNETQFYDGAAWQTILVPWTTFTPTWTNLTVGNATQTWAYQIVGDIVMVEGRTTLGSTSSVTGTPTLTLPVNRSLTTIMQIGFGVLGDAGTATFQAYPVSTSGTNCVFFSLLVSGTYAAEASTSATVPFTWTNGDFIAANLIYKKA